jgi:hypothetical protein
MTAALMPKLARRFRSFAGVWHKIGIYRSKFGNLPPKYHVFSPEHNPCWMMGSSPLLARRKLQGNPLVCFHANPGEIGRLPANKDVR